MPIDRISISNTFGVSRTARMYRPSSLVGVFPLRARFDPEALGGSFVVDRLAARRIIKGDSIDLSAFHADPHIGQELYAMGFSLRDGDFYSRDIYTPDSIASAMFRIIDEGKLVSKYGAAHGWATMTLPFLFSGASEAWNPFKRMFSDKIDLSGACLPYADLGGFDLSMANLRGAKLTDCDLSEADLSNSELRFADMSGSVIVSAFMRGADMRHANLAGASIKLADFTSADLSGAVFSNAVIVRSRFDDAVCMRAVFKGAFMKHNTYFRALFSGADLAGAEYDRAELLGEAYYDSTIEI